MSGVSGFYDPSFPHSQHVNFPDLSTESLLAASTSKHSSTQIRAPFSGYEHPEEVQLQASKERRASRPAQVKHRRTRNGCYTCRSRRIKCDEQRPTCERCSKGKRECTYPEPRPNPSSIVTSKRHRHEQPIADNSRSPSVEDEDLEVEFHDLSEKKRVRSALSIDGSGSFTSQRQTRDPSGNITNWLTHNRHSDIQFNCGQSLSPSTDTSSMPASAGLEQPQKFSSVSTNASHEASPWSHLSADLRYYLDYHQENITYHHYFLRHGTEGFVHNTLFEQALQYEPLLYAVVGFAAFHLAVKRQHGRIQDFLGYYDKSVSSLRKSLAGGQTYTDATFLTTLQLATFEEYLGDYVSLLGHQQAAYRMLLELYSPETIMTSKLGRQAIEWYTRFELTSGLMSENVTALSQEWFLATEGWFQTMSVQCPDQIEYKIGFTCAKHRTLWAHLALLFSKLARGPMTSELQQESDRCAERIEQWIVTLDPYFKDEQFLMKDFKGRLADPGDIVDPFVEIWREPMFAVNFMFLDWSAMSMLFKMKIAQAMHLPAPSELESMALEACRVFETIEYWPESPAGSILKAKSVLGVACLFLPKDYRHTMWCRTKLAKIESLGHVYPPAFRQQMASMWSLPEINKQWWIPNEKSCPAVIRSIRSCMGDRLPQVAHKSRSEDQRNIKGIFSHSTVEDEPDRTVRRKEIAVSQSFATATRANSRAEPVSKYTSHLEMDADLELEDSLLEQSRERFRQTIQGTSDGAH